MHCPDKGSTASKSKEGKFLRMCEPYFPLPLVARRPGFLRYFFFLFFFHRLSVAFVAHVNKMCVCVRVYSEQARKRERERDREGYLRGEKR